MNKNKGFTLIELLVVIAIIGILSSVVLASLSGARTKAKIAAVQSTLSSMRAQAEIGVTNGYYIANICAVTGQGGLGSLMDSLNKTASKITSFKCGTDVGNSANPRRWAVEVLISSKYFCADSSGYNGLSKKTTGSVTTEGTESTLSSTAIDVGSTVVTQSLTDYTCSN